MEEIKNAQETFKLLCEHIIHDLNRYNKSDIDKDYFYNPKYECGFVTGGKTLYTADILKALEQAEENEKAMKIIVEKNVCFYSIKSSKNAEEYNKIIRYTHGILEEIFDKYFALTQAEFELVKRGVDKYGSY